MTVSTTVARISYAGNGSTTVFSVPYYFLAAADLKVWKRSSSGVETLQALNSQYTVSGAGNGSGGSVAFATAPASGETVVIVRDPIITQETDYQANDAFPAETHERALDRLTMVGQRHADLLTRALVLAESDTDGAGAFQGRGNRITGLAPGTQSTDAVTLLQVQDLIAISGGGGGSGGGGSSTGIVPDTEVQRIINLTIGSPELADLFTPLNVQYGSLADQILALNSSVGSINTSVGTITTQIVDMQAEIDALSAISGDATNVIALITTETATRITNDSAILATIAKMGAADGDNVSFLMNMDTVKLTATETMADRFTGIATQFSGLTASVASEATARTTADTALATTIAKIGALNGGGTAFIFDLNTAYVGASESLGQRLSGIASALNSNSAAILSEQIARANADSALSSTVTTLQSTVNGHTTTISAQATTLNGIQAKYSVKIDNNGNVAGFDLISTSNVAGGTVSKFRFTSTAFEIWNGTSGTAPFSVVGGVVYINEANIKELRVEKLITGGESQFVPRAWARMYSNSSGAFLARSSNVASISRISQGKFQVTFATPLASKYYNPVGNANISNSSPQPVVFAPYDLQTTGFKFVLNNFGYNERDADIITWVVFGDNTALTVAPTAYDPQNDPAVSTNWNRTTNSGTLVP